jgi:hypothetical protein
MTLRLRDIGSRVFLGLEVDLEIGSAAAWRHWQPFVGHATTSPEKEGGFTRNRAMALPRGNALPAQCRRGRQEFQRPQQKVRRKTECVPDVDRPEFVRDQPSVLESFEDGEYEAVCVRGSEYEWCQARREISDRRAVRSSFWMKPFRDLQHVPLAGNDYIRVDAGRAIVRRRVGFGNCEAGVTQKHRLDVRMQRRPLSPRQDSLDGCHRVRRLGPGPEGTRLSSGLNDDGGVIESRTDPLANLVGEQPNRVDGSQRSTDGNAPSVQVAGAFS